MSRRPWTAFSRGAAIGPTAWSAPEQGALNQQNRQQTSSPARTRQILINMERWRWLPNDLGSFYVTVNIPEFTLWVMEDGKPGFTTRAVVGKPDKQTPVFSNEMQTIVFNPYWNVPNSIKMEEVLPSITGGGGGFFGGGGFYDASVFARNGLRVAIGTREVDPSQLDWSRIDIRSLNVYQPPGPTNVLGVVKFLFPNKHDVYMHDTTQRNLFAKTVRAESHGCMRVQNPEQLATILLQQDQGWSAERSFGDRRTPDFQVPLRQKIPVYITYFTLKAGGDGSIATFRDLYGHDARMASVMFGEPMPFDVDTPIVDTFPSPLRSRPGRCAPSSAVVQGVATALPTPSRAFSTTTGGTQRDSRDPCAGKRWPSCYSREPSTDAGPEAGHRVSPHRLTSLVTFGSSPRHGRRRDPRRHVDRRGQSFGGAELSAGTPSVQSVPSPAGPPVSAIS